MSSWKVLGERPWAPLEDYQSAESLEIPHSHTPPYKTGRRPPAERAPRKDHLRLDEIGSCTEEGSRRERGSEGASAGRKKCYVVLFIDSAAEITKLFQRRIKFGEFFP